MMHSNVTVIDGVKIYTMLGRIHRIDGPAVEHPNGKKVWKRHGETHRLDGPAIEHADGSVEYWVYDTRIPESIFNQKYKITKTVTFGTGEENWRLANGKLHREDQPAVIYASGTTKWYYEGNLHRTNGPAVERINGQQEWWQDGLRHRLDGPAVIVPGAFQHWYKRGNRHRLDGPASEWSNGDYRYYIDGIQLTEKQFHERKDELLRKINYYKSPEFIEIDGKRYKVCQE